MMSSAFSLVSATSYLSICTYGLMSCIVSAAESSFLRPTSFVPWMICRCRFVKSTTSKSTMPMRPTPAAARYIPSGAPSPPVPTSSTLAAFSFSWPSMPTSGMIRCRL